MAPGTALGFFWAIGGATFKNLSFHRELIVLQLQLNGGSCIVSLRTSQSWLLKSLTGMVAVVKNGKSTTFASTA